MKNKDKSGSAGKPKPEELNELEELRKKSEEHLAGWQRALADYDNLLKNLDTIKSDLRQRSKQDIIESLLPILDNFDQALSHAPDDLDEKTKNWLSGVLHIQNQFSDALKDFGAQPYGQVGDLFDPHLHDAVEEVLKPEAEDQSIIKITLRGWKIKDKIIRPAKVIINNLK